MPIPLRTQRARAPTRRKAFLRNYGKQKKCQRTLDTNVIPFRLDRQAKAQEKEEAADADITGLRILVAEDNELNMEIARFILEDCGALVEPVSNGLEAVHKFEASAEEAFDVILMDIMMPVMDGITATKTIRAMERPDA